MRHLLLLLIAFLATACGGRDSPDAVGDAHWILGRILRASDTRPTSYTVEVVDPLCSPWTTASDALMTAKEAQVRWTGEPVAWGPDGRTAVLLLGIARGTHSLAIESRGTAHRNVATISRIRAGGEP